MRRGNHGVVSGRRHLLSTPTGRVRHLASDLFSIRRHLRHCSAGAVVSERLTGRGAGVAGPVHHGDQAIDLSGSAGGNCQTSNSRLISRRRNRYRCCRLIFGRLVLHCGLIGHAATAATFESCPNVAIPPARHDGITGVRPLASDLTGGRSTATNLSLSAGNMGWKLAMPVAG